MYCWTLPNLRVRIPMGWKRLLALRSSQLNRHFTVQHPGTDKLGLARLLEDSGAIDYWA